jgi:hypothetical protein
LTRPQPASLIGLEIRCRTIEQMRMVNALCRFVEESAYGRTPNRFAG